MLSLLVDFWVEICVVSLSDEITFSPVCSSQDQGYTRQMQWLINKKSDFSLADHSLQICGGF